MVVVVMRRRPRKMKENKEKEADKLRRTVATLGMDHQLVKVKLDQAMMGLFRKRRRRRRRKQLRAKTKKQSLQKQQLMTTNLLRNKWIVENPEAIENSKKNFAQIYFPKEDQIVMGGMLVKNCQKCLVSMVMVTMMLTLRLLAMLTVRMTRRQGHDVRAGSASLGLPPSPLFLLLLLLLLLFQPLQSQPNPSN